jgi:hypothetical protein
MNKLLLCVVGVFFIGNFFGWNLKRMSDDTPQSTIIIRDTVVPNFNNFSEDNLMKYIKILGIKHPDIVMNQARLETGNFTSNRFKKYNALFGFQSSDTNVHKYNTWKESVIAYKMLQMKYYKDDEDYYKFLSRIKYAQDSLYIVKLKKF